MFFFPLDGTREACHDTSRWCIWASLLLLQYQYMTTLSFVCAQRSDGPVISSVVLRSRRMGQIYNYCTVKPSEATLEAATQKEDQTLVFKTNYRLMQVKVLQNAQYCNTFYLH